MTERLDQMISALAGSILDAASAAPVEVREVSAELPMEFGLARAADGLAVVARPPQDTQARDLARPVGAFTFRLSIGRGGLHG